MNFIVVNITVVEYKTKLKKMIFKNKLFSLYNDFTKRNN